MLFDKKQLLLDILAANDLNIINKHVEALLQDLHQLAQKDIFSSERFYASLSSEVLIILMCNEKYLEQFKKLLKGINGEMLSSEHYDDLINFAIWQKKEMASILLLEKYKNAKYPIENLVNDRLRQNYFYYAVHQNLFETFAWFLKNVTQAIQELASSEFFFISYNMIKSSEMLCLLSDNGFDFASRDIHLKELITLDEKIIIQLLKLYPKLHEKLNNKLLPYQPVSKRGILGQILKFNLLHFAIYTDHVELAKYLLEHTLKINISDPYRANSCEIPSWHLVHSPEMAELLISKGLNKKNIKKHIKSVTKKLIAGTYGEEFNIVVKHTRVKIKSLNPCLSHKSHSNITEYKEEVAITREQFYCSLLHYINNYIDEESASSWLTAKSLDQKALNKYICLASKANLSTLTNILSDRFHEYVTEQSWQKVLLCFLKNNNYRQLDHLMSQKKYLSKESIITLAEFAFTGLEHKIFNILIRHYQVIMLNDRNIRKLALNTPFPKIAICFMNAGLEYPTQTLNQLKLTAKIQNDPKSLAFINKKLHHNSTSKHRKWPYNIKQQATDQGIEGTEILENYYGKGITQQQYQAYSQTITNVILSYMLTANFNLLDILPHFNPSTVIPVESNAIGFVRLGEMRQWIAVMSNSDNAKLFGKLRPTSTEGNKALQTPLKARYHPYLQRFISDILPQYQNSAFISKFETSIYEGRLLFICNISGKIKQESITLTKYRENENKVPCWVHTKAKHIANIIAYVQTLIDLILSKPIDINQETEVSRLIEDIAKVHWWLSHTTITERGNAAVTEWIIKALFLYHGINISWNTQPDCEALIHPDVDHFAKQYHKFLKNIEILPKCGEKASRCKQTPASLVTTHASLYPSQRTTSTSSSNRVDKTSKKTDHPALQM